MGFNNSNRTWIYYNDFDGSYRNSFRRLDYPSKGVNGISHVADKVLIDNTFDATTKRIGVGHSMGGLVIKELIRKNPNTYGGFITIGTPHRGSRIANAVDNGKTTQFFKDINSKLMNPVRVGSKISFLDFIDLKLWIISPRWVLIVKDIIAYTGIFVTYQLSIGSEVFYDIANDLIVNFVPVLIDKEFAPPPLRNDLKVGSAFTKSLESMTGITGDKNFPMVTIYGEEKDRALYRLIGGRNDEDEVLDLFNSITNTYFIVSTAYYTAAAIDAVIGGVNWWNPFGWYSIAKSAANAWAGSLFNDTGHYLKNNIHNEWSYLIGAYRTEHKSYSYYKWVCTQVDRSHPNFNYWNNRYNDNDADLWASGFCTQGEMRRVTVHYTENIRESSDGLLNKTTQTDLDTDLHLRAEGANHLEQTKHKNVKDRLRQLFNGELVRQSKRSKYFKLK